MPSSYTFPNGQTLVSSALAPADLNQILQALIIQILGINPSTDPLAYSEVRIGWLLQPGLPFNSDICTIRTFEQESDINRIRDLAISPNGSNAVTQTYTYTRVWRAALTLYGSNCFDRVRQIKSALLLDWVHDTLAASNLYLIPSLAATTRLPELFEGRWWDRVDYACDLNEGITETISIDTLVSAEVIVDSSRGVESDATVT